MLVNVFDMIFVNFISWLVMINWLMYLFLKYYFLNIVKSSSICFLVVRD